MKKFMKKTGVVIGVLVFVMSSLFIWEITSMSSSWYKNYILIKGDVVKKTVVTGKILPRKEIAIKPQISGIIEKIYFKPGEQIKKGDVIAKVKVIPEMVNLNEAESRKNIAIINFETAKKNHHRISELFKRKLIAESEFEISKLNFETAKEQMESAENNLKLVKDGIFKEGTKNSNTLITSTINGTILEIPIKEGNNVIRSNSFNEGTTIAVIAEMNDMIFQGKIVETEINKLYLKMPLKLKIAALENQLFEAELEYIAPKGVEENGAVKFEIKAKVKLKSDSFLRAGVSANADLILDKKEDVLLINERFLNFEKDKIFVELLAQEDDYSQSYEKKYVTLGVSDGINIEVIAGLKIGDKVKGEKMTF